MRRALLCDPGLTTLSGHCYTYLHHVRQALERDGWAVALHGHRMVARGLQAAGVHPTFTLTPDDRTAVASDGDWEALRARHEPDLIRDLTELDRDAPLGAGDLILVNTLHHWSLRALFRHLASRPTPPALAVILHFSAKAGDGLDDVRGRMYRDAFEELRAKRPSGPVILMADTVELVHEFENLSGEVVDLAPIPHSPARNRRARPDDAPLTIGFVGEARFHKGFHLLPYVVSATSAALYHGQPLRFIIQSYTNDPSANYYRKSLPHLAVDPRVELVGDMLSIDSYEGLLDELDLALLPYSLMYYRRQSSGVFSDLMARGVPCVVTAGTWMAREVERSGAGLVVAPEDYAGLAAAVRTFVDRGDDIRRAAQRESVHWLAFHRPESLVAAITSRIPV